MGVALGSTSPSFGLSVGVTSLTDSEIRTANKLSNLTQKYRLIADVDKKGDNAKYHIGHMVQTVYNTFEEEGLDASKYNMWIADDVYSVDGSFYDSNNDSYNSKTPNAIHSI